LKRILAVLAAVGFCLGLSMNSALADATIEQTFKTSGVKGMGASEGATTMRYQGEKGFETTQVKFTGAFLSRLAGGGDDTRITRVDKGVYWRLHPKDRAYEEEPIKPFKQAKGEPKEKSEKTHRVTKCEVSVKKTGAKEAINGFPCEEYLITWLLEVEELETKEKSRSTMLTNLWTTPETADIRKARADEERFHKALAKRLGLEFTPEQARMLGREAVGGFINAPGEELDKGFKRFAGEMAKVKGYPIRTVVSWNVEEDGQKAAASEEAPEVSGGLSGILGGLAGRFAQKKVEKDMAGKPFFSSTMEVKRINAEAVPAESFEIPSGYKKK
jgi:hypothetical protein